MPGGLPSHDNTVTKRGAGQCGIQQRPPPWDFAPARRTGQTVIRSVQAKLLWRSGLGEIVWVRTSVGHGPGVEHHFVPCAGQGRVHRNRAEGTGRRLREQPVHHETALTRCLALRLVLKAAAACPRTNDVEAARPGVALGAGRRSCELAGLEGRLGWNAVPMSVARVRLRSWLWSFR
jgi:hypothetical protein